MLTYLANIDYDHFILDLYAVEEFFAYFNIDVATFDQTAWEEVMMELEIYDIPYQINYILDLLETLGVDTTMIDLDAMYDTLITNDWNNFVLDMYVLDEFLAEFGIDSSSFDQKIWEEIIAELEIIDMPYEVHYILDLLEYVGADTTNIDQNEMLEYLNATDWDNFVLDEFAIEEFFTAFGIDSSTFDQVAWEEVKAELDIINLPYEVHYILNLLEYVGFNSSSISQTEMQAWLLSVNWDNFVLDMTAIEEFFVYFNIPYTTFDPQLL